MRRRQEVKPLKRGNKYSMPHKPQRKPRANLKKMKKKKRKTSSTSSSTSNQPLKRTFVKIR
jgi:hypothetical protein